MAALDSIPPRPVERESDAEILVWVLDVADGTMEALLDDELEDVAVVDVELKEDFQGALAELRAIQLPWAKEGMYHPNVVESLDYHGLSGQQLAAKTTAIERFLLRLRETRLPKWLKKLLGALNVLLNSIALVNPPAGAVAELKGSIEWTLDYGEEGRHEKPDDDGPEVYITRS